MIRNIYLIISLLDSIILLPFVKEYKYMPEGRFPILILVSDALMFSIFFTFFPFRSYSRKFSCLYIAIKTGSIFNKKLSVKGLGKITARLDCAIFETIQKTVSKG